VTTRSESINTTTAPLEDFTPKFLALVAPGHLSNLRSTLINAKLDNCPKILIFICSSVLMNKQQRVQLVIFFLWFRVQGNIKQDLEALRQFTTIPPTERMFKQGFPTSTSHL
jgi:hypothetical protein